MVGLAPEFANRQASLPCLLVLAPFAVMDHMTSSFLISSSLHRQDAIAMKCLCVRHGERTTWDVLLKRDEDLIDASRSNQLPDNRDTGKHAILTDDTHTTSSNRPSSSPSTSPTSEAMYTKHILNDPASPLFSPSTSWRSPSQCASSTRWHTRSRTPGRTTASWDCSRTEPPWSSVLGKSARGSGGRRSRPGSWCG